MAEPLNLTHLRSLVAVVDRKSFTRAAQVLRLSQSTVSQHVRLLERRVGVELFVRAQRGVQLTPRGGSAGREAPSPTSRAPAPHSSKSHAANGAGRQAPSSKA